MLLGRTEPRVFTPPLRPLTPETSLGFAFADFCRDVCSVDLVPWQEWLGIHLLEIVGTLDGDWHFRFRTVIVLVARQQGKSTFLKLLKLFFMYVLGVPLCIGTAQNLDTAEEVWSGAVELAESVPDLMREIEQVVKRNGKKELRLKTGERYKIVAASRKGGRGFSSDFVTIDELREQQNWDAWGAVTKTTMARPNALVVGFSNAGDATSVVLRHLRTQAHVALGDPDGFAAKLAEGLGEPDVETDESGLGIFEWSAPPVCDVSDRSAWAFANPSLGYGFVTERALASSCSTDPEPVFRTECLCQWVESVIESAFPDGAWEAGVDDESEIADDSDLTFGIDVSSDRVWASVGVCGRRPDGSWHVELVARRKGFEWVTDLMRQKGQDAIARKRTVRVAFQGRGAPVTSHVDDLETVLGLELVPCEGRDVGAWSGRFFDAVATHVDDECDAVPVFHRSQPTLDHAATVAQTKPLGESWAWNRSASVDDISPLVAVNMAFGAATKNVKESTRTYESAYATRSLLVV